MGGRSPGDRDAGDGELRPEEVALVERLRAEGVDDAEIWAARDAGRLGELAIDTVHWGIEPRVPLADLAGAAGVDPATAAHLLRAAGFTSGEVEGDAFVAADRVLFESFALGREVFGEDVILQFTRVAGAAAARVAEAAVSMFATNVGAPMSASGAPIESIALVAADATERAKVVPELWARLFAHHFQAAADRDRLYASGGHPDRHVAVGFADLAGSTTLARRLGAVTWAAAMADFEGMALDLATRHGARVVKFVGDQVMLVAESAPPLAGALLDLVDEVARHPQLSSLRGGLADGPVLPQGGDYHGVPVILASRAESQARPGEVLATADAARALPAAAFTTEPVGEATLKGFDGPVPLLAVRRA